MRRVRVLSVIAALFMVGPTVGEKYAVLVSSEYTYADNDKYKSAHWYALALAYETLVNHGYGHDEITVLYNCGEDFQSKYPKFQNVWACNNNGSITDTALDRDILEGVLDSLGENVVSASDTFLIWWTVGHGHDFNQFGATDYYNVLIKRKHPDSSEVGDHIDDTTLTRCINLVDEYALRVVLWATCNAGGMIDGNEPDTLGNDSTIAIAAVQYHNAHGTYVDTLYGTSSDVVKVPALTAFASHLMNWHDYRGNSYTSDGSGDGYVQLSELVYGIDSLYGTSLYQDGEIPDADTVQVLDQGNLLDTTELVRHAVPSRLEFRYSSDTKMRVTNGGYSYFEGTVGDGTPSGLLFGGGVGLSTSGNLSWGDTLLTHQEAYFDSTGSLSGGLVFRSECGEVVHFITSVADTVMLRGWSVEDFAEF